MSGELTIIGEYGPVRAALAKALESFAAEVTENDGIIGHIKASAEVTSVEMFSVTDEEVMVKSAPQQEIAIILAAIIFGILEPEAEAMGKKALETLL